MLSWAGSAHRGSAGAGAGRQTLQRALEAEERARLAEELEAVDAQRSGTLPKPLPPSCTDWTRLVLPPVLSGHVSSFSPY